MKTKIFFTVVVPALAMGHFAGAQHIDKAKVPDIVKKALTVKYPLAKKITWEKEKGNFEANWGGKTGEGTTALFTPTGVFVEEVIATSVRELPPVASEYVKAHYKGSKIIEVGKMTDASGKKMFEAEIKGKDLIFDRDGKFIKED